MFKIILFHPGIDLKQKLYLFYTYYFCYYYDWFMYLLEKYFIELNKLLIDYLRIEKMRKKWKRLYKIYTKKEIKYHNSWSKMAEKDYVHHIIKNNLDLDQSEEIKKNLFFYEYDK